MTSGFFEFDNLATASLSATFNTTGLVGVPLSYTLSYNLQGGSGAGTNSSSPLVGSAVALPAAPTRAGYVFTGWYTAATGGSPLGANFTQSATGNTALQANTYTRSDFTFAGWNTTISGTGTSYANGATFNFTTPTTLYAQWTVASNPSAPQLPLVTTPVTTTPPSTTTPRSPTTTAPTTTVPAPVPNTFGVLPDLQPGESAVIENQLPVPVEVFLDDTNTLVMRGQHFELNLAGQCDGGCDLTTDSTGRQVLQVQQDGNAFVGGFGFMPGTLVHIWMFSEPTYLGALTVANDGTFQGSVFLQGITPGTHTLQVNGTSFDGNDRSANLGVVVLANNDPSRPLPATGNGNTAPLLVLAALAMVILGALARRRPA